MNNKAEKAKEKTIEEMIQFSVEHGVELTIREGEALKLEHPENIHIVGAIDAPSRWVESRKGLFETKKSFTLVSRDEKTISFYTNELASHGTHKIVGKMVSSKDFIELGINNPQKVYSAQQLANVLKLRRSIFPVVTEHAFIIQALRTLKARITKQIEDTNDNRGNVTKNFEQAVESNMPEAFRIKIQLIKGEPAVEFPVTVLLEADGSEIRCYLESVEAAEMIDNICETRINEEIEKIKDFTTIIEQ